MKKLKTLISVMLCAMLVLSLVVPSMADTTYSVTVNNAIPGETYTLYKIFDFESHADDPEKGVYTVKGSLKTLLEDNGSSNTGVTLDPDGKTNHEGELYVTSVDDEVKFSKFLHDNVNSIGTAVDSKTAPTNGKIVFQNVTENGYYFVDTTAGSLFILDSTTPDMVVDDKNKNVTITKKVSDAANGTFTTSNNAQIGDTVYFKAEVTIPKGATNVVVHDIMESGLTLIANSVEATVGGTALGAAYYTVNYSPAKHDDNTQCTFEVTFQQGYLDSLSAETTTVVLTYKAELNQNATCGNDTNDNTTKVKYGDNSWTTESTTYTKTLDVNLQKTDNQGNQLPGAEFTLKKDGVVVPVVKVSEGVYRVAVGDEEGEKIVAGNVLIKGLDFDEDYVLEEDKAPAGYNRVNGNIPINKATNTIDFVDMAVVNETGTELPDTGSTGTKILFTVGGIMMVVAFVLFTSKRRMAAED